MTRTDGLSSRRRRRRRRRARGSDDVPKPPCMPASSPVGIQGESDPMREADFDTPTGFVFVPRQPLRMEL